MTVTLASYRLLFYSEKLLPRVNGLYTGCRIASTANGYALATLGESTLTRTGRTKGKAARRADLLRGMKGTGEPTRPSYNQSHVAGMAQGMYPGLPQPQPMNTRDWGVVTAKLDAYAISIAVKLSALPPSAELDDYTRADHQILIWGKWGSETRAVDPMHEHSDTYIGDKVPLAEVRKAAAAIDDGLYICELFPRGQWTAEAMLRRDKNADIKRLDLRVEQCIAARNELRDANREQAAHIAALEAQLADAGNGNQKAAGWESALVHAAGAIQQLRTMGPGGEG